MSEKTKKQLESVRRNYFTPDFESAYSKLMKIKEVYKRAVISSQVKSVMKQEPNLKPSHTRYEEYLKEHKEWTKKRNEHYNNKKDQPDHDRSLEEICKEKESQLKSHVGTSEEVQSLREHMLCLLMQCVPKTMVQKIDWSTIQVKQQQRGKKHQNYMTRNYIYFHMYQQGGVYGSNTELKYNISDDLRDELKRFKHLSGDVVYLFGDAFPPKQSTFSNMIKREFGVTLSELRKMV